MGSSIFSSLRLTATANPSANIVHKSLINSMATDGSVSNRVAYLTLEILKRYSLNDTQVGAIP